MNLKALVSYDTSAVGCEGHWYRLDKTKLAVANGYFLRNS